MAKHVRIAVGVDSARCDVVEGNAFPSLVLGQVANQVGLRRFERPVNRELGVVVFLLYTANGNDSSPITFHHGGCQQLNQLVGRLEISHKLEIDLVTGDVEKLCPALNRSIGNKNVHLTCLALAILIQGLGGIRLGEVARAEPDLVTDRF